MIKLDSISIDGVKDVKKLRYGKDAPHLFVVELWIKYVDIEDAYEVYSTFIANPKGIEKHYSNNKTSLNGSRMHIFNEDMDYDKLFNLLSHLVNDSIGRNEFETCILLQRYFDMQDIMFATMKENYYYLFDKLKKK